MNLFCWLFDEWLFKNIWSSCWFICSLQLFIWYEMKISTCCVALPIHQRNSFCAPFFHHIACWQCWKESEGLDLFLALYVYLHPIGVQDEGLKMLYKFLRDCRYRGQNLMLNASIVDTQNFQDHLRKAEKLLKRYPRKDKLSHTVCCLHCFSFKIQKIHAVN